ncbi:hypothetical protein [Bradyrhizobium valentinum]|uniref:hypothetical protein n=1 Tax=Bradyrhizobium valentinum TaxID=1518501 RepID=UPI0018D24905|nr:hypothetical protein [Bradyrhizobium valentinum]
MIERIAANAADANRLSTIAEGAAALFNCANPAYDRWLIDWPPISAATLKAAERSGAVLATHATLYPYGPGSGVMTEATPLAATHPKLRLRGEMWRNALELHQAGRIRATEIRASDHIQPQSLVSLAMFRPMLAGKRVMSPVLVDVPRTWTSIRDAARLLTMVAADERAWGKAWHVPSHDPMTARELLTKFAKANGLPEPRLSVIPWSVIWAVGIFAPLIREIRTTRYQFTQPFIMDSRLARETFGMQPEPLEMALRDAAQMMRTLG